MLLVGLEQAAMDDWKWTNASRLLLLPDPPFHHLLEVQGSSMAEPLSHLADPAWMEAVIAYSKDLQTFRGEKGPKTDVAEAGPGRNRRGRNLKDGAGKADDTDE